MSEDQIVTRVLDKISDYFDENVHPYYRRHHIMHWSTDPFIRGTFSGYSDLDLDDWLLDGIGPDQNLSFAGEAFPADGDFQAWVHTAMYSGVAAAGKIIDAYETRRC